MYCKYCGKEIDDRAVICPGCGIPVYNKPAPKPNVLAIVGFVLSFLLPIAGLVCSILGRNKANSPNGEGQGMALAGIVISIVMLSLELIATILSIALGFGLLGQIFSAIPAI